MFVDFFKVLKGIPPGVRQSLKCPQIVDGMHSPATPISLPSAWGEQKAIITYTSVNIEDKPSLSHSKSLFSTKLSDKSFRSISSTGEFVSPYSVKGTISFASIHRDITAVNAVNISLMNSNSSGGTSNYRPGVPTGGNGETPPATGQLVPVGDMLLPMLAIALGYIVVKLFRNRKTSQAL